MIRVELAKQWRRPRTVLTLAALALFTVVLTITLGASGAGQLERVGDIPLLIFPDRSGFSVPVIALASTMIAVAIFAGESVAGEAGWGSLRYALAGPVSRRRYLLSKLVVAMLFSLARSCWCRSRRSRSARSRSAGIRSPRSTAARRAR